MAGPVDGVEIDVAHPARSSRARRRQARQRQRPSSARGRECHGSSGTGSSTRLLRLVGQSADSIRQQITDAVVGPRHERAQPADEQPVAGSAPVAQGRAQLVAMRDGKREQQNEQQVPGTWEAGRGGKLILRSPSLPRNK